MDYRPAAGSPGTFCKSPADDRCAQPHHRTRIRSYPYLPDAVLNANLQRLKQTLASDKELVQYADLFLWKNAERLFISMVTKDSIVPV
jgi:hypothetical protein